MVAEFIQDKTYCFVGSKSLVENMVTCTCTLLSEEQIYLGNFIEYMGIPYVGDWMYDGKAKFEFGVISKGYYDKIVPV